MTEQRAPQDQARELAETWISEILYILPLVVDEAAAARATDSLTEKFLAYRASLLAGAVPQGYARGFRDGFTAGSKNRLKIIWDKWCEKGMDQVLFTAWLGRELEAGSPLAGPESTEQTHQPGAVPQEELRELIYRCIKELDYVQSAEHISQCASAEGKELIELGMKLLGVQDLSLESLIKRSGNGG